VSRLRSVLVRAGFDAGRAITSVSGCYQLHLPADAWLDVEACTRAIDAAEAALRHGDVVGAWGEATVAASIGRRPVLAGDDLPWVDDLRASLATARVRALGCLTEVWLARGVPALAIRLATESVALDPFREPPYRQLMAAHFLAGDRAQALRTYERCARLLAAELGVAPHPETTALRDRLSGA
jgi:DNA-binding SARP family transcriptional activator